MLLLGKCLYWSHLFIFKLASLSFYLWALCSLCILDTWPLSEISFVNNFFLFVNCLFTFHLLKQNSFNFESDLPVFCCLCFLSFYIKKKIMPSPRSWKCILMISFKSSTVLALTFWSWIHFELIFIRLWGRNTNEFFCMCWVNCLTTIF